MLWDMLLFECYCLGSVPSISDCMYMTQTVLRCLGKGVRFDAGHKSVPACVWPCELF